MDYTFHFQLRKPSYDGAADINDVNVNMDNIDSIVFTIDENSLSRDTELETLIRSHIVALELDHPDASVTTDKIRDSNITTSKIMELAVTTGKLANLGVTTEKIANDAVTDSKIGNRNVNDPESDNATYTGFLTAIINKITSAIRSLRSNVNSHIGNISNPHSVTAEQAGAAPKSHTSADNRYGISSRSDYGHSMSSSAIPIVSGEGAAGLDNGKYANEGHVHPAQTSITGNAGTSSKWLSKMLLNLIGDASGTGSFDGSETTNVNLTLANSGVTAGTYTKTTVDAKGRVTSGSNPSTLSGMGITDTYTAIQIDGKILIVNEKLSEVEAIARGASRAFVFETLIALNAWLAISSNIAQLRTGDNLFIIELGVPDYWWDGTQKQILETEKVDLSNIYTKDDIAILLSGKEPVIAKGTSSQYWNGLKAWTDFATSVRAALLTGLSTASTENNAVTAADSLLIAIGKLQAQINATVAGNVTSASKWYSERKLSLTGDGAASLSVDGSKDVSAILTLATSGATAGSYGPTAAATLGFGGTIIVPYITVDVKGRVTAIVARNMILPATPTSVTGTAGNVTGIVAITNGGTGLSTAPSMLINLASTTAASPLAASPRPGITGILPIANGGTGNTTGKAATADELNYTGY